MEKNSLTQNPEESIYILLTDTGTLFTRMIKAFTGAPYNHASIALDERLEQLYSFGRKRPNNPLAAGFVREYVEDGVYRKFPNTSCALLRLRVTKRQRERVIGFIRDVERNKENYRYNLLGVLSVLLNIDYRPEQAYFCSQFVAEAINGGGVSLWNRPSARVTPNDFRVHPSIETIYEGPLYAYPPLNINFRRTLAASPIVALARKRA
ncbi:hypothetical protein [Paenibacillus arenilitoris]|uniref:hypothetical protein n=1 Tax=Paenibacillus arenilitoris TaxID=2772299 RepID=UPI00295BB8EC|nr:hypothetical protein [Paenibacillus arenilitoris]